MNFCICQRAITGVTVYCCLRSPLLTLGLDFHKVPEVLSWLILSTIYALSAISFET